MDDDVDLEIEVSDLRTGQTLRPPLAQTNAPSRQSGVTTPSPPLIADASQDEITVERLSPGNRDPAQPPRWPRLPRFVNISSELAHYVRGLLVGAAVLVVFGGLLLSLPVTQQTVGGLLRPPTPTATVPLPFGANLVLVTHGVPWGTLRVDGQVTTASAYQPLPVSLGRGRHRLEYQAAPFAPLHCTFSVPAATDTDTYPLARDAGSDPSLGDARTYDLEATPNALSPAQRHALTEVVTTAIAGTPGTATVAAGDHYLGPAGAAAVAHGPLRATLRFTLNTDPDRSLGPFPSCVTLCVAEGTSGEDNWALEVHVTQQW